MEEDLAEEASRTLLIRTTFVTINFFISSLNTKSLSGKLSQPLTDMYRVTIQVFLLTMKHLF